MSLVFDARKNAERSKRARALSQSQGSPDLEAPSSNTQDIPPDSKMPSAKPRHAEQLAPQFGAEKTQERASSPRVARADAAWATGAGLTGDGHAKQEPIVRSLLRIPRPESPSDALAVGEQSLMAPASVQQAGTIQPAALISRNNPIYPASAKGNLLSGNVQVHFRISPEGKVYNVKSVNGPPILARAAIAAVETWCYEPARLYGAPVDSHGSTNFDFKLDEFREVQ